MRLWAAAHAVDDMYQGLVPASVPYFVLDRHYSYVAASGLALAATLGEFVLITFTDKAARELRQRIRARAGGFERGDAFLRRRRR